MQRKGLWVVVREASHIRPVAPEHVLLVRLLLLAFGVLLIAFAACWLIFFDFVVSLRCSRLCCAFAQIQRAVSLLLLPAML
jgi:hypothetical protein